MEPLCRLCLQDGPDLRPIPDDAPGNTTNTEESIEQSLVQLILQYLSIQVIKIECTENPFICTTCQTLIEEWHRFHNACLKNDEIYQQRLSELLESAVEKQENQISQSLAIEFKQEELENSAEDHIDDDLDPDFEPLDEEHYSVVDADDDVVSAYTTSEDEMAEKVQPTKRTEKSNSMVIPKKRGRPTVIDIIEDADGAEVVMKSGKRAEVCTICGNFIKNMTEHMRIHNNERRHQCPYCPKAFVSASNYCSHVNIHTRAKMYKCDLCDKQYAMLNSLKQHRITHFKERIYLCPVCGKAYYQPTGLARHKRTHFEEPKIKCSECDKMFLTNSDLRKHFTKHLPEKPFCCEICNRAFSRKDNLRTHMKTHRGPKAPKTVPIEVPSDTGPNVPKSDITIKLEPPKGDL